MVNVLSLGSETIGLDYQLAADDSLIYEVTAYTARMLRQLISGRSGVCWRDRAVSGASISQSLAGLLHSLMVDSLGTPVQALE